MSKYKQRIKGGRAKKMRPSDFDSVELERGIAVEREHTGRRDIAREIAMDHLAERPDYYEVHAAAGLNPKRRSKKNPRSRQPSGDPVLAIRTFPGGIFGGGADIYLLTNAKGETVDAISTAFEDFGPMESAGYGDLPILELEVSGKQFRQLEILAKQLQATVAARPKYRPSRSESRRSESAFGMTRALNNPRKRKLMGNKA